MIDLLKYLRIFSDLFTNFTFPQWGKKKTQNINWQWHTSTKITLLNTYNHKSNPIRPKQTEQDQIGPNV